MQEHEIKRERAKAQELRKSRWWQTRIAAATCYYCQVSVPKAEATMDHVVPLAQGGKSVPGNIVVACKSCNTAKRDMTAVEWQLTLLERADRSHT